MWFTPTMWAGIAHQIFTKSWCATWQFMLYAACSVQCVAIVLSSGGKPTADRVLGLHVPCNTCDMHVACFTYQHARLLLSNQFYCLTHVLLVVVQQALLQAKEGRAHILGEMAKCNPPPRGSISSYVPFLLQMKVDTSKIGTVIGPVSVFVTQFAAESLCYASSGVHVTILQRLFVVDLFWWWWWWLGGRGGGQLSRLCSFVKSAQNTSNHLRNDQACCW